MLSRVRWWGMAIGIGVVNAIIFKVFEVVVNQGSDWLWNDVFRSDTYRWVVIPLAISLSFLFSLFLFALKETRWTDPDVDIFAEQPSSQKTTVTDIGHILLVGASSLLAGAALGPEMSLTESSRALGEWAAQKLNITKAMVGILVAASIGALMVAFMGSLILMLLPFAMVYQKTKKIPPVAVLPIMLACTSAYGTLWVLDRGHMGFGDIPVVSQTYLKEYVAAAGMAVAVSVFSFALVRLIARIGRFTEGLTKRWPWYVSACVFGAVLSLLYAVGGETIQFSGSEGTKQLVEQSSQYGTWVFLGLALAKAAAMAWSKATGYRGGLFFPSIYVGVALSLFAGSVFGPLAGAGATVGAVAGIFAALTGSAMFAGVIIVALLPIKLLGVAVTAIAVASLTNKSLSKLLPTRSR